MSNDSRIDSYIAEAAPFAQPILKHLRSLIHRAAPEAEETIKWSMPFFTLGGKIFCHFAAFKAHCRFGIHGGKTQIFGKIATRKDLPSDPALTERLKASAAAIAGGKSSMPRRAPQPRPPIEVPSVFADALKKNKKAAAAFENFAPSHRREYLEWIVEAKRDETRERRIAQAIEWIAEGKQRNWKYAAC